MLKLPKGLKKKKKGKKSKKDQELFTEEELQQYKREHQTNPEAEEHPEKTGDDDEWSKFAALTTGVDSILKKTQGDLDRIKSTSFFQRVAPKKVEPKPVETPVEATKESPEEEKPDRAQQLLNAVVELSDSESDSDFEDTAFDTSFVDRAEAGELPLAFVPESPEEEPDLGPDPFDTAYADKIIKGPEVSKRGKKLVDIGSAVGVLTGQVETAAAASKSRRQRRGIQNLLLESFEANLDEDSEAPIVPEQKVSKTLLDEPAELSDDIPIDLSVSLHLTLQQNKPKEEHPRDVSTDVLNEFDVLRKDSVDDEFAQLAAESLTRTEEITVFEDKNKPKRPPPPSRPPPPTKSNLQLLTGDDDSEDEADLGDDPFDTAYVEKVVPKQIDYDDDFDPRGASDNDDFNPRAEESDLIATPSTENKLLQTAENLSVLKKDLLSASHTDLASIVQPLAPSAEEEPVEVDPFDTSAVDALVAPGKTELKYLEKELLESDRKNSLSDDDFDPRAGEEQKPAQEQLRQRKSSLSLHLPSATTKLVSFIVTSPDLLKTIDAETGGKIQKPLTPYYNRESSLTLGDDLQEEDPFDTSFVPTIAPSSVELDLIEKEIFKQSAPTLRQSLSDPDFDPRAITPIPEEIQQSSDLFLVADNYDIKVLTPSRNSGSPDEQLDIDPFDTSIAINILPGSAELKLLEEELIEKRPEAPPSTDILSDTQDNSIYAKILTPEPTGTIDLENQEDFDPFDTSFAANLAPGETEIKLLENELIN